MQPQGSKVTEVKASTSLTRLEIFRAYVTERRGIAEKLTNEEAAEVLDRRQVMVARLRHHHETEAARAAKMTAGEVDKQHKEFATLLTQVRRLLTAYTSCPQFGVDFQTTKEGLDVWYTLLRLVVPVRDSELVIKHPIAQVKAPLVRVVVTNDKQEIERAQSRLENIITTGKIIINSHKTAKKGSQSQRVITAKHIDEIFHCVTGADGIAAELLSAKIINAVAEFIQGDRNLEDMRKNKQQHPKTLSLPESSAANRGAYFAKIRTINAAAKQRQENAQKEGLNFFNLCELIDETELIEKLSKVHQIRKVHEVIPGLVDILGA